MARPGRHRAPARRPPVRHARTIASTTGVVLAVSLSAVALTAAAPPSDQPGGQPSNQTSTHSEFGVTLLPATEPVERISEPQPSRSGERPPVSENFAIGTVDPAESICPGVDSATDYDAWANGAIPTDAMCELPQSGEYLQVAAAVAWDSLNAVYRERFGADACVTDSFRSLDEQHAVYASKPTLAAEPGTSDHGFGVALDLCGGVESFSSEQHAWFADVGPEHGWINPDWAQPTGSRPEPWHWEYVGA